MMIKYYPDLLQGSDEWLKARLGLLTASEMKLIISPAKLQYANNDKMRSHLFEIAAQRISQYVEPSYISDDMLRGQQEEIDANAMYNKHYAQTQACGFITNDKYGFILGYSPDALVGDDGLIECKSRCQKYQIQTIYDGKLPDEYLIQCQTALLVTERKWLDFVSYSGGLPMFVHRVLPDDIVQKAIISAATQFHVDLEMVIAKYRAGIVDLFQTERRIYDDIITGGGGVLDDKAFEDFNKDKPGAKEAFWGGRVDKSNGG